jgi:syntaxin 16
VVNQINDLAVLFKELSNLVIEQGSVLDRIDFNIEQAHSNVKKGNVALEKTLKKESSWRAKGCITCQVLSIMICTGLMVLKHAT